MERIGVTSKIDNLGRIVIPKTIRDSLNLVGEDKVEWFIDDNSLIMRKRGYSCVFCSDKTTTKFKNLPLCKECREDIKEDKNET